MEALNSNYYISKYISAEFFEVCSKCAECKWYGTKIDSYPQWKLGGPGHTRSECIDACRIQKGCNFVSHSISGYCHMSMYCDELDENHRIWGNRLRKITNEEETTTNGRLQAHKSEKRYGYENGICIMLQIRFSL